MYSNPISDLGLNTIVVSERQLLTAVVCSELYKKSHTHFLRTNNRLEQTIVYCVRKKLIKPLVPGGAFYKLTPKGSNRLRKLNESLAKAHPKLSGKLAVIDKFIDEL